MSNAKNPFKIEKYCQQECESLIRLQTDISNLTEVFRANKENGFNALISCQNILKQGSTKKSVPKGKSIIPEDISLAERNSFSTLSTLLSMYGGPIGILINDNFFDLFQRHLEKYREEISKIVIKCLEIFADKRVSALERMAKFYYDILKGDLKFETSTVKRTIFVDTWIKFYTFSKNIEAGIIKPEYGRRIQSFEKSMRVNKFNFLETSCNTQIEKRLKYIKENVDFPPQESPQKEKLDFDKSEFEFSVGDPVSLGNLENKFNSLQNQVEEMKQNITEGNFKKNVFGEGKIINIDVLDEELNKKGIKKAVEYFNPGNAVKNQVENVQILPNNQETKVKDQGSNKPFDLPAESIKQLEKVQKNQEINFAEKKTNPKSDEEKKIPETSVKEDKLNFEKPKVKTHEKDLKEKIPINLQEEKIQTIKSEKVEIKTGHEPNIKEEIKTIPLENKEVKVEKKGNQSEKILNQTPEKEKKLEKKSPEFENLGTQEFFYDDKLLKCSKDEEIQLISYNEAEKEKFSKEIKESICAFLNSNGGRIFIGLKPTDDDPNLLQVDSLHLDSTMKDQLKRTILSWLDQFSPPIKNELKVMFKFMKIKHFDGEFIPLKYVIQFEVIPDDKNRIISIQKQKMLCFVRRNGKTVQLNAAEIKKFILEKKSQKGDENSYSLNLSQVSSKTHDYTDADKASEIYQEKIEFLVDAHKDEIKKSILPLIEVSGANPNLLKETIQNQFDMPDLESKCEYQDNKIIVEVPYPEDALKVLNELKNAKIEKNIIDVKIINGEHEFNKQDQNPIIKKEEEKKIEPSHTEITNNSVKTNSSTSSTDSKNKSYNINDEESFKNSEEKNSNDSFVGLVIDFQNVDIEIQDLEKFFSLHNIEPIKDLEIDEYTKLATAYFHDLKTCQNVIKTILIEKINGQKVNVKLGFPIKMRLYGGSDFSFDSMRKLKENSGLEFKYRLGGTDEKSNRRYDIEVINKANAADLISYCSKFNLKCEFA